MTPEPLDPSEGLIVFTDGSAYAKDRTGGWAYVVLDAFGNTAEGWGWLNDTTISQMELSAPRAALYDIHEVHGACDVLIQSDSQYVVLGFMNKRRARRANVAYWNELEEAAACHDLVVMEHVKGHDGHQWNERADELAGKARQKAVEAL